jgi:hypothetical protein
MNTIGPRAEPVVWSTIVGLVIAAAASYGFGVTDELNELLVFVVPMIVAAIAARQNVYAPDTFHDEVKDAFDHGFDTGKLVEPEPPA